MTDIKAGDLVMVVRPLACCGWSRSLGAVFVVSSVERRKGNCLACGASVDNELRAFGFKDRGIPLYRLIRIDPPALPESVETTEELTA